MVSQMPSILLTKPTSADENPTAWSRKGVSRAPAKASPSLYRMIRSRKVPARFWEK